MSLASLIAGWLKSNATQYVVARIPDADPPAALVPDRTYVGLWLSHGFLAHDAEWFKHRYPVVHAVAGFRGPQGPVSVTKLARPAEGMLGPGVWVDYEVTGLVPYRGGSVELEAGLDALEGSSIARAAVDVLAGLSALVAPPLSAATAVAGAVGDGVEKLLAAAGDDVVLGLHETFAEPGGGGGHALAPGYLAVVKAESGKLDPDELGVEDSRLCIEEGGRLVPLEGHSYLLFRVEAREERTDWRFPRIEELLGKAVDAHLAGEEDAFAGYRAAVLSEVLKSPGLTSPDRFRIARAVAEELQRIAEVPGHGAIAGETPTFESIAGAAAPLGDPAATGSISLEELLA